MRKNIIRVTLGRASRGFFSPLSKREQFCFSRKEKKEQEYIYRLIPVFLGAQGRKRQTCFWFSATPFFGPPWMV